MKDSISLRRIRAESRDLLQLEKLAREIWTRVYRDVISDQQIAYMLTTMYRREVVRSEIRRDSIFYYFCNIGGIAAGFAAFQLPPASLLRIQDPPIAPSMTAIIHKLYLMPNFHGQGIGTTLLQLIEDQIKTFHPPAVYLTLRVNVRNKRAIAAYGRNGYRQAGKVITGIGQGFVMDDYLMAKYLQ